MKTFTKFIFSALLVFSLLNTDTIQIKRDGIRVEHNQLFAQDVNKLTKKEKTGFLIEVLSLVIVFILTHLITYLSYKKKKNLIN